MTAAKGTQRCSVDDCPGGFIARGLCSKHYQRFKAYGDPAYVTRTTAAKAEAAAFWQSATDLNMLNDGPCLEWTGWVNSSGYGTTKRNGQTLLHRAVWVEMRGPIPPGMCVCHHCDNRRCCRSAHLFLGTNMDNVADKMAKGRHVALSNEAHGSARLTDAQVREVREMRRVTDLTYKEIAKIFGVYWGTVYKICHGEARASVLDVAS